MLRRILVRCWTSLIFLLRQILRSCPRSGVFTLGQGCGVMGDYGESWIAIFLMSNGSIVFHLVRLNFWDGQHLITILFYFLLPNLSAPPVFFAFRICGYNVRVFLEVIRSSWEEPIEAYGMYRFTAKLKRLRSALKEWNRTIFGNVFANVRNAESEVKRLGAVFDASHSEAD